MNNNQSSTTNSRVSVDGFLLINGQWEKGEGHIFDVLDKYSLVPVLTINSANDDQIQRMVNCADAAFKRGAPSPYERSVILERAAVLLDTRRAQLLWTMQTEAGFTASDANGEIDRCIQTLGLSADEARRLAGDVIPLQGAPGQAGRLAFTLRVPLGVVLAITPFNSPLNTVAHKIAPAFAAGNAVILKPSSSTPMTAHLLMQILVDAGMPAGFLSIVHGSGSTIAPLLEDQRIRFFAFTGSTEVGRRIQQVAGLRRTQMELGAISFTILCDDADLDRALPKIVGAGYRKAGQVCTSVQILLVSDHIMATVKQTLACLVAKLRYGNPKDAETQVGPMITEKEAVRVEQWIDDAIAKGAECIVRGKRRGAVLPPTLMANINDSMFVSHCEIFGPVVCLVGFGNLDEAIERVNATAFGLAAGIFTNRLQDSLRAAQQIVAGGVHVNETSSARVDMMPYGGSKDSGFGREGPHYAVHEMSEERVVTFSTW